jgi:hypothetical protein
MRKRPAQRGGPRSSYPEYRRCGRHVTEHRPIHEDSSDVAWPPESLLIVLSKSVTEELRPIPRCLHTI